MTSSTPPRGPLAEFLDALLRPSAPALLGTLAVAAATLSAGARWLDEEAVARLGADTLRLGPRDDHGLVSARALALRATEPEPRTFLVLGASGLQLAITSTADLERELAGKRFEPATAWLLTARGLDVHDLAGLIDAVGAHATGALVVNVAPGILCRLEAQAGRGGREPLLALGEAGRAAYGSTGEPRGESYLTEHLSFLSLRLTPAAIHAAFGPLPTDDHVGARTPSLEGERAEYAIEQRALDIGELLARIDTVLGGLDILGAALDRVPEGVPGRVVLLESPLHPEVEARLDPDHLERYRKIVGRFATGRGALYWRIEEVAELAAEDFHDPVHVSSDRGRERFTAELGSRLRRLRRWESVDDAAPRGDGEGDSE